MKNRLAILCCIIGIGATLPLVPSKADGTTSHGHLLSVWAGIGQSQTHAIVPFEGTNSFERCTAAAEAMRGFNNHFDSDRYTRCIPF